MSPRFESTASPPVSSRRRWPTIISEEEITSDEEITSEEEITSKVGETPLGRIGLPKDIAAFGCLLLGEESRFMTGQTVVAGGGRVLLP